METLNLVGLQSNHNLAAALQDVAFGQFVRMVEYRALKRERIIMKSDTFFPSSKTCSKCGVHYGGLKLSERDWVCPVCGHHHDRDRNAAMMLEKNGVELYNAKILEELNKNSDTTAQ
jgi:putative transposase